jgi:inorganic pyrophosphatase
MPRENSPLETEKFEIQAYRSRPRSLKDLWETHVPFTGSPRKHPNDPKKLILVTDPYSSNTSYYEFVAADISHAEELPSVVDLDGTAITMARVWVKKMSVGIRCTPFLVEDIARTSK